MKAHTPLQVAALFSRRLSPPTCPECNDVVFVAAGSEYVTERHVRHLWVCDACGYEFQTSVDLSSSAGEPREGAYS
jgi:ribosomal protein L37AE/L43A